MPMTKQDSRALNDALYQAVYQNRARLAAAGRRYPNRGYSDSVVPTKRADEYDDRP